MKKKRLFIICGIIAFIIIIVLVNVLKGEKRVSVEVAEVERGEIEAKVSAPGRVKPFIEVKISSDIPGKIVALKVKEGSRVKPNEIVARLDSKDQESILKKAESGLKSALSNLNFKKITYNRKGKLFKQGLISNEEFLSIKTEHEIAETQVEQAKASVEGAKDELRKTQIVSPIEGVVTELNVEEGEIVVTGTMNNPGTVLMIIGDMRKMVVECEVDESDVVSIKEENEAEISIDAYPDTTFKGRVIEISSAGVTERTGTYEEVTNFKVKVEIVDSIEGLRPNMSATSEIITEFKNDGIRVPIQSVVVREKKEGVFVVRDGKAELTLVTTGISTEKFVEITKGLSEGEKVVSGSYKTLSDLKSGTPVKIIEKKETTPTGRTTENTE